MIPGEYFIDEGDIEFNSQLLKTTLTVKNTGDRPIQVGSHYHFYEVNPALLFEKLLENTLILHLELQSDLNPGLNVP